MAILMSKDDEEMIVSCNCGCDEGMRIRIDKDDEDDGYAYNSYLSGKFYSEQGRFKDKMKKIWAVIRNKDFYYNDICMSKKEFEEFKEWINRH
jgi:hypothetical protein